MKLLTLYYILPLRNSFGECLFIHLNFYQPHWQYSYMLNLMGKGSSHECCKKRRNDLAFLIYDILIVYRL